MNAGVGSLSPSPGDLPSPGIEPRSLTLQEDGLQTEPPGKPKNTGAGSLFLLQGSFLTQVYYSTIYNSKDMEAT